MAGEQQHYVPKFLLRNFTHGKKPHLFVYDKSNDKRFQTNIKNIAAENGFYNFNIEDEVLTLEPSLADFEAISSGLFKRLVHEKNLTVLAEQELITLSVFLAIQFVRTKEHRLRYEHLGNLMVQKLRDLGATEDNIKEFTKSPDGIPEEKLVGIKAILNAKELAPHFLNKAWVLYETTHKHPFFTSDNPLVLHNSIDHGPYGNLGLAVRGIEIFLPISTTLCLCLLCPTIAEEFQNAHENMKILDQLSPGLADSTMQNPAFARAFCNGLMNGTPIKTHEDNVTMINSLQVRFSSRFVYCETDTFDLVKRMIKDNEKYREGHKPTVD
jgi:hypothetical protein